MSRKMKEWDNDAHEQALQRRANKELEKAKAKFNEDTLALSAEEYGLIRGDKNENGDDIVR